MSLLAKLITHVLRPIVCPRREEYVCIHLGKLKPEALGRIHTLGGIETGG